jgi:hypothetical protein
MDRQVTFTVKITMPYHTVETAHFYLSSALERIKTDKDLININEYEIVEANVIQN